MAGSVKEEKDHENGEEKQSSGMIKNILLFSNLVSHKVEEPPHDDVKNEEEEEEKKKQEEKGVFENLISNLVSPRAGGSKPYDHEIFDIEDGSQVLEEETVKMDDDTKKQEEEEGGGGGGGLIDSIVSHLPKSLPEDAAPTTVEASILIHSIIHD